MEYLTTSLHFVCTSMYKDAHVTQRKSSNAPAKDRKEEDCRPMERGVNNAGLKMFKNKFKIDFVNVFYVEGNAFNKCHVGTKIHTIKSSQVYLYSTFHVLQNKKQTLMMQMFAVLQLMRQY